MYGQIKGSHSIHILSIQIDIKVLNWFININLTFFASYMERSFHYVRLLETLE